MGSVSNKTTSHFTRVLDLTYFSRSHMSKDTTDYNSKLDLVFTNNTPLTNIDSVDVIENYWSHHKIVYCVIHVITYVVTVVQ
jgi:hypothetical protein